MPSIPLPVEPRTGDQSRLWGAFIGVTPCDQQVLRSGRGAGQSSPRRYPQRPRLTHRWNHGLQARAGKPNICTPQVRVSYALQEAIVQAGPSSGTRSRSRPCSYGRLAIA